MTVKRAQLLLPLTALALVACGDDAGKAPAGQVVATVDGQEITSRELKAEMGGIGNADPRAQKAAEQAALQGIVNRRILAIAAREQAIDKSPEFALQRDRATEALLARTLEQRIAKSVPAPTREDAERFIADHPDLFAQRKIFEVDQIRMARPSDPETLKLFVPLKTLEEVEQLLNEKDIPYRRAAGVIDAIGTQPEIVEKVAALPAGEVFVIPSGDGILVNSIRNTRTEPYTGPRAMAYALAVLREQRVRDAVQRQVGMILREAQGKVRYNDTHKPPPATPAAQAGKRAAT